MKENFIEVKDIKSEETFVLNISNIKSIYIKERKFFENYVPEEISSSIDDYDYECGNEMLQEKEWSIYSLILETTIANEHRALVLFETDNKWKMKAKYSYLKDDIGTKSFVRFLDLN